MPPVRLTQGRQRNARHAWWSPRQCNWIQSRVRTLHVTRPSCLTSRHCLLSLPSPSHLTLNSGNFTHCLLVHCSLWLDLLCGAGAPLFLPCLFTSSFPPFYFFLSFLGFTYFLILSIPSLSTRIVPLRFQAGGRRRRPNLGLVCFVLSVFLS